MGCLTGCRLDVLPPRGDRQGRQVAVPLFGGREHGRGHVRERRHHRLPLPDLRRRQRAGASLSGHSCALKSNMNLLWDCHGIQRPRHTILCTYTRYLLWPILRASTPVDPICVPASHGAGAQDPQARLCHHALLRPLPRLQDRQGLPRQRPGNISIPRMHSYRHAHASLCSLGVSL